MATKAQIEANRRNAQKSTGPRTAEGKRAVSQNAITHGLFASEAVIKCEDIEQFELHRDAMLGELRPVGVMESFLAERMVSLSWRMMRAERMQNEATDCMIDEDHLSLGRMATKKWSNNVITLEKLLMIERRLESSFNRTMNKLRMLQKMRRIELEDAAARAAAQASSADDNNSDFAKQTQSPAFGRKSEARNSKLETNGTCEDIFAKQTQFARELIGATPSMTNDYDDEAPAGRRANKANRSQFSRPISRGALEKRVRPEVRCP